MGGEQPQPAPPATPTPQPVTPTPQPATPAPPTVIPAPPIVIPAQAGTHARRNIHPFPNSSLLPSRGEVRWGLSSRNQRHPPPLRPNPSPLRPNPPPPRPDRHSCAGRNPRTPQHPPLPRFIPPPFQGEVRWGLSSRTSATRHSYAPTRHPYAPTRHPDAPTRHPYAPTRHPRAPNRHSCAGRNPRTPQHPPFPQFTPPPFQGGG